VPGKRVGSLYVSGTWGVVGTHQQPAAGLVADGGVSHPVAAAWTSGGAAHPPARCTLAFWLARLERLLELRAS